MEHEIGNECNDMHERIFFRLSKGEDGYPPNEWESLWGIKLTDYQFQIDNIPFFIRDISLGDIVIAKRQEQEWHFQRILKRSQNSVMRIIVFDPAEVVPLRNELQNLGCTTESFKRLLAVDIPRSVSISIIDRFLQSGEAQGKWEYEDASIRH